MNCKDCLLVIEEYFDGELADSQTVAKHLAHCSECAKAYQMLKAEQAIYDSYQRNIEVTPMLWAGIEAQISERATTSPGLNLVTRLQRLITKFMGMPNLMPVMAAVGLVVFTVITTIVVMHSMTKPLATPMVNVTPVVTPNPEGTPNREPMVGKNSELAPVIIPRIKDEKVIAVPVKLANSAKRSKNIVKPDPAAQLLKEAEEKYLAAITILSHDAQKNYRQLSPKLRASFDKSLQVIDENIAQTRRAVRQNPNDVYVAQYMLATYAKKVEVLKEIVAIDQEFGN